MRTVGGSMMEKGMKSSKTLSGSQSSGDLSRPTFGLGGVLNFMDK